MINITPTRLYIKQHSLTGMLYFGKSIKENIETYNGSGKLWLRHIKKHGIEHVLTIWVSEWFFVKEQIEQFALSLSTEYDIVNSDEWANLKEETGTDGGRLPDYALASVSHKLTGRTKETHDYIRIANQKKSLYNAKNSEWIRKSREKFKTTIENMTKEERNQKFGHSFSDEIKNKLSLDRIGKTKDNCERVKKMSDTKRYNTSLLTDDARKKKFSTTTGRKWYHCDINKKSILVMPELAPDGYQLGRKYYED